MQQDSGEAPSPHEMKRLDAFLDCIAYLLAKRWLRDQRQQEEKPRDVTNERSGDEV